MPKPKGKGGKNRRKARNTGESNKRELVFKEEGQEYAQVLKMLGNGRLEAYCFDGTKRMCHIRGKLKSRVWINPGDIILISLRDFQDGKADVIQKYYEEESRSLKSYGELPESTKINEDGGAYSSGDEDYFNYENDEEGGAEENKGEINVDDI